MGLCVYMQSSAMLFKLELEGAKLISIFSESHVHVTVLETENINCKHNTILIFL